MLRILPIRLLLLFSLMTIIIESSEWSYEDTKTWRRKNRYCAGHSQSPIDIQFNISYYDRRLRHISIDIEHPRKPGDLLNSGHTVQLNIQEQYVFKHVAPESEDYKVEQLHFHWGHSHNNDTGSEHLLDGNSYPLDMHIVSYSSWFSNIREAMSTTRGLAVIGVFFELSDQPNPFLQPIIDGLSEIPKQGQHTFISNDFNLKALIGESRLHRYYRYDGSLTTPPCFESVIWTVLVEPLKLSFDQLQAFRKLYDDKSKQIANTYRKVQSLGTRKIYRSFLSQDIAEDMQQRKKMGNNGGSILQMNIILMFILSNLYTFIF